MRLQLLFRVGCIIVIVTTFFVIGLRMFVTKRNLIEKSAPPEFDSKEAVFRWQDDPQCERFTTTFGSGLPLVYLVSFPRSGNSWMRYLLEGSTGIFTGSVYSDNRWYNLGYLGELEPPSSGRILAVKTHAHSLTFTPQGLRQRRTAIPEDTPVILIIRNPARAIISYWNLGHGKGEDSFRHNASTDSYNTTEFRKFVKTQITNWREVALDRLLWSKNIFVLQYEKLIEDPVNHLREVISFMGLDIHEDRLECLNRHLDGDFKGEQRQIDTFTALEKEEMQYSIDLVSAVLSSRGIDKLHYAI